MLPINAPPTPLPLKYAQLLADATGQPTALTAALLSIPNCCPHLAEPTSVVSGRRLCLSSWCR
jgi:hypothetical protein